MKRDVGRNPAEETGPARADRPVAASPQASDSIAKFGEPEHADKIAELRARIAALAFTGSEGRDEAAQKLAAHTALSLQLLETIERMLKERGPITRRVQAVMLVGDRAAAAPRALVTLPGGQQVEMPIAPDLAARVLPGKLCTANTAGTGLIAVLDEPPLLTQTAMVQGLHQSREHHLIEVSSADGNHDRRSLLPAWTLDRSQLKVGDKVRTYESFVYDRVEAADGSAFTESHRWRAPEASGPAPRAADLVGRDQHEALLFLETTFDRTIHSERYPSRRRRGVPILIFGTNGIGKSELVRIFLAHAARLRPSMPIYAFGGNDFLGGIIGQTTRQINELFDEADRAAAKGPVVISIEEVTSLLRARSASSQHLDSGVGLQQTESLMARIDSAVSGLHPNILMIMTGNRADLADRAMIDRLCTIEIRSFGPAEAAELVRRRIHVEPALFSAGFDPDFDAAVRAAAQVAIGSVMVGKDRRTVEARHILNGRAIAQAVEDGGRAVERAIYVAAREGIEPILEQITPELLCTSLVRRTRSMLATFTDEDARDIFPGSDLCRDAKAASIHSPEALPADSVVIPSDFDARRLLEVTVEGL